MTLTKAECLEVSNDCLANAETKYENALILSRSGSFGDATSLLIVSLEEMMKATILRLDSYGFQFRTRVAGIQSIFKNHKLRFYLAFVLSLINMLGEDFKRLIIMLRDDPSKISMFDATTEGFEDRIVNWFKRKSIHVNNEVSWFQNADMFRQEGFYVDFDNEIKTPLKVDDRDFQELKVRIDNFRKFLPEFLKSFDPDDQPSQVFVDQINNLQKMFISNDIYEKLGNLVPTMNSKDAGLFQSIRDQLDDIRNNDA